MPRTDEEKATLLTAVLLLPIAIPAIVIAAGYIVSKPIWLVLGVAGFNPAAHPMITNSIRVFIVLAWLGLSWYGIRLIVPRRRREEKTKDGIVAP